MSEASAKRYWERHARHYDRSMLLLGGPLPKMVELTAAAVRGMGRVLEVAAGTGLVTAGIARVAGSVVATDYAAEMVERLAARVASENLLNVEVQQADLYALPFEPCSFDAVVAANVLHLVPDVHAALSAMRRVLSPEGRLVLPTYCHDETLLARSVSRLLALSGFPGRRRFSLRSLEQQLKGCGVRLRTFGLLPGVIPIAFVEAVEL